MLDQKNKTLSSSNKIKYAVIILAGLFAAVGLYHLASSEIIEKERVPMAVVETFELWSRQYKKVYATPAEKEYRLNVFHSNLKSTQEKQKKVDYEVGLTFFSDMTISEAMNKFTGMAKDLFGGPKRTLYKPPNSKNPKSIDWRKEGKVSPIRYQNSCGACWSFAAVAALETAYAIKTGDLKQFSEQQLLDCTRPFGNTGCSGGWMHNAYKYLEEEPLMLREDYPYENEEKDCRAEASKGVFKLESYVDIPKNNMRALESAVANHGTISIAIDAGSFFNYRSGILDDPDCGFGINHGVSLVGYGSENGKDYWIVRNQWDTIWGEDGYVRVAKYDKGPNDPGMCGIYTKNSFPVLA